VRRLVLIVRCLFWATGAQVQAQIFDRGTWNDLLQRHVKPILGGVATQVDYAGMARERTRLKGYLDTLAAVPEAQFWRWPKDERPAFLINAYNAWTVERVLTRWPKLDSIKDLGSLLESPWKRRFIPLLGQTRSLGGPGGRGATGASRYPACSSGTARTSTAWAIRASSWRIRARPWVTRMSSAGPCATGSLQSAYRGHHQAPVAAADPGPPHPR